MIRKTARKCLAICVKSLSTERRENTIVYWERFCKSSTYSIVSSFTKSETVPVQVPPELFSSKEVVRSVIILGQLIIDHSDNVGARC